MNILFVCTGNTCRSPMAEGILKKFIAEGDINVESKSAGIFANPGSPASSNAILSMKDIGIDIESHISQNVTLDLIEANDLILTMTKGHKDILIQNYPEAKSKTFLLNEYSYVGNLDIKDPYGASKREYDTARDEILIAIKKIYNDILKYK